MANLWHSPLHNKFEGNFSKFNSTKKAQTPTYLTVYQLTLNTLLPVPLRGQLNILNPNTNPNQILTLTYTEP